MKSLIPAALLALAISSPASAHPAPSGWEYPLRCCSNKDCAHVDQRNVHIVPGGFEFRVPAGTHPMVPAGGPSAVIFVPHEKAERSPDGEPHICLNPERVLLCAFIGPFGF